MAASEWNAGPRNTKQQEFLWDHQDERCQRALGKHPGKSIYALSPHLLAGVAEHLQMSLAAEFCVEGRHFWHCSTVLCTGHTLCFPSQKKLTAKEKVELWESPIILQQHNFYPLPPLCWCNDAFRLASATLQDRQKGGFKKEVEEEFEDSQGNVYNRKTYEDLKRQGLIWVISRLKKGPNACLWPASA